MLTHAGRGNRARFATTRWSLVLAVADRTDRASEAALAALCELYWFPIYAFIRRSGRAADAAADLTQGFFTAVVEKGFFAQADRDRGRRAIGPRRYPQPQIQVRARQDARPPART